MMPRKSFKSRFYSAADLLSDCWEDGLEANNFTLWK